MKKLSLILFFLLLGLNSAIAKHPYPEKFYQQNWCKANHGFLEYKLIDDTRVDCLTKEYAVEFDFAPKWAEAIGQSLHYARMTGKKAGINLIIEDKSDFKYYHKIEPLCKEYNIALWYSEMPKNPPEEYIEEDGIYYLLNLIVNFIKSIIKLFG